MDFSSFLTSLATSFLIFLVLMLLFAWVSSKPGNAVIYYPNRLLKNMDPYEGSGSGRRTRNPFSWIVEAFKSKEEEIVAMSGVDTAVYFVFLSTVVGILVLAGVILLPVLLPVAATDIGTVSSTSKEAFNDLDKLAIGHVQQKSPRLWAFVIGVYWASFLTYYLLWKAYKHVSDLRASALEVAEPKPEQFAVLVRDIPPVPENGTRKEQVDSYFRSIYQDSFYRSVIVTDNKKVNKIWKELEDCKKKLERAKFVYGKSKTVGNPNGTQPTSRIGFLGLVGKKVETIEYLNEKISELVSQLETEQKVTIKEKQQCSAIIFFTNRVSAASAAQSLHARMVDTWTVMQAPEPRQIIWSNLSLNYYEREVRKYVVYFIVALTIFFYMIPIGFISALTTLDNLVKLAPFLKPVVKIAVLRTVLEAYLPQLALIIFLALLPKLLMTLSKMEGIPSISHAIRATSGKYFYFTVLNVFIGVTLGGTLFTNLKAIENSPNSAIRLLATSLPGNATFFLTFVALKFFVGYGLELSRIVPLIIYHLKVKYLCKTEDDIKEAWAPGDLGYATRFPADMLILTIVLCYSVIAPMIIPFGLAYFGIGWLVLRNQALKVYVPSFESYGRMWPHMHMRVVSALLLYQVTMVGYFGIKEFVYTPVLVPLPVITFIFAFVCSKKFYGAFERPVLEVVAGKLKEAPDMGLVFREFIPPSLQQSEKADEDEFEDASAAFSRSTSFV